MNVDYEIKIDEKELEKFRILRNKFNPIEFAMSFMNEMEEKQVLDKTIKYLESKGYKITPPPKQVKDEYTFENAWNLYQKKVGCKDKLEKKWNSMSLKDRKAATEYIPAYVLAQPDKKYRKNFQTFLNQRGWEDEIIGVTPPPAITNEQPSTTAQLIQQAKVTIEKEKTGQTFEEERKRLLGIINMVKANPKSFARISLENYYKTGYLQKFGIQWHP